MSITVGVYIGKKDRIIRYWYETLPRGQFPVLVKFCILSYLKGTVFPLDTVCEVSAFREQLANMPSLPPTQRNVTFTKDDGSVYDWVMRLEPGFRSEEIKNVLQRTINHTLMSSRRSVLHSSEYPVHTAASGVERRDETRSPVWGNVGNMIWEDDSAASFPPARTLQDSYGWEDLVMTGRGRSLENGKRT